MPLIVKAEPMSDSVARSHYTHLMMESMRKEQRARALWRSMARAKEPESLRRLRREIDGLIAQARANEAEADDIRRALLRGEHYHAKH